MNLKIQASHWQSLAFYGLMATGVLLIAGQALSQTVYRSVGPDGKVTFSDQPPAASSKTTASGSDSTAVGASAGTAISFTLRQVVNKYPVTLYTSDNCAPCGSGRVLLSRRGIPFTEKTVNTAEDAQALQRISGENSLPFLTIGSQQIKGYSDSEWTQFLNAAGYPQNSALPAGYRNPAATPLVTVLIAGPKTPTEAAQEPGTPAAPSPPANDPVANPAGIKF